MSKRSKSEANHKQTRSGISFDHGVSDDSPGHEAQSSDSDKGAAATGYADVIGLNTSVSGSPDNVRPFQGDGRIKTGNKCRKTSDQDSPRVDHSVGPMPSAADVLKRPSPQGQRAYQQPSSQQQQQHQQPSSSSSTLPRSSQQQSSSSSSSTLPRSSQQQQPSSSSSTQGQRAYQQPSSQQQQQQQPQQPSSSLSTQGQRAYQQPSSQQQQQQPSSSLSTLPHSSLQQPSSQQQQQQQQQRWCDRYRVYTHDVMREFAEVMSGSFLELEVERNTAEEQLADMTNQRDEAKRELKILSDLRDEYTAKISLHKDELRARDALVSQAREKQASLETELKESKKALDEAKKKASNDRYSSDMLADNHKRLQKEVTQKTKELAEATKKIEDVKASCLDAAEQLGKEIVRAEGLEAEAVKLQESVSSLEKQVRDKDAEYAALSAKVGTLKMDSLKDKNEVKRVDGLRKKEKEEYDAALAEVRGRAKITRESIAETQAQVKAAEDAFIAKKNAFDTQSNTLQLLQTSLSEHTISLSLCRNALNDLAKRLLASLENADRCCILNFVLSSSVKSYRIEKEARVYISARALNRMTLHVKDVIGVDLQNNNLVNMMVVGERPPVVDEFPTHPYYPKVTIGSDDLLEHGLDLRESDKNLDLCMTLLKSKQLDPELRKSVSSLFSEIQLYREKADLPETIKFLDEGGLQIGEAVFSSQQVATWVESFDTFLSFEARQDAQNRLWRSGLIDLANNVVFRPIPDGNVNFVNDDDGVAAGGWQDQGYDDDGGGPIDLTENDNDDNNDAALQNAIISSLP